MKLNLVGNPFDNEAKKILFSQEQQENLLFKESHEQDVSINSSIEQYKTNKP